MQKITAIIILVLISATSATAQWEALIPGGFFGDVGVTTGTTRHDSACCGESDHGTTFFGLRGGYLMNATVGAGVEVVVRKPESVDATWFVSPRVLAVPIRQGEKYPVTITTDVTYHLIMPPGDGVSGNGYGVGVSVSRSMKPMKDVGILPHVSVRFSHYGYQVDVPAGGMNLDYDENPLSGAIGVTASLKKGPGLVTVTPHVTAARFSSGDGASEVTVTDIQFGVKVGVTLKK